MYLLITTLLWKKFNMKPTNKVTNLKVVKKIKETSLELLISEVGESKAKKLKEFLNSMK